MCPSISTATGIVVVNILSAVRPIAGVVVSGTIVDAMALTFAMLQRAILTVAEKRAERIDPWRPLLCMFIAVVIAIALGRTLR
ncbi:MAG: hypothetical protein ACXWNK_00535 [Vulcanimicrobiaceae bacterium]